MRKNYQKEVEKYVESKRNIWSDRSCRNAFSILRTVGSFVNSPDLAYQYLVRKGLSTYSIRTYFLYVSGFEKETFGTAKFEGFLKHSGRSAFKNCYREQTSRIKLEEYRSLKEQVRDKPAVYNALVLMAEAGLRASEALNVKFSDFQSDGFLKIIGKGNKQRLVPFKQEKLLMADKKISYRTLNRYLKPFNPHGFRSFYATEIANHPELNLKDAQILLGHSSIQTTARYVRSDLERVKKVLNS